MSRLPGYRRPDLRARSRGLLVLLFFSKLPGCPLRNLPLLNQIRLTSFRANQA